MNTWWKRLLPLLLIALVAGIVGACGDDDDDDSSEPAAESTAAAEDTAAPADSAAGTEAAAGGSGDVKIVSDLPLQGVSAAQATTINNAIQLYLEQQGGKAGGFNVTFEAKDDATAAAAKWDPATCSANAQEYAGDESIVGIIGTFNSGCAKLIAPVVNQAGPLAMVSPANTATGLTHVGPGSEPGEPEKFSPSGQKSYTRVVPSDDYQAAAVAQFAQELGVKKVYILNDKEAYGSGLANAAQGAFEKLGVEVLGNEGWDGKAANYDALFEKIKGTSPDAIFLSGVVDNNGGQLIKDKVKVLGDNETVKLIGPDGFLIADLPTDKVAGSAAEGMYLTFAGADISTFKERGGRAAEFITAYEEKYGPAEAYTVYGAAAAQVLLNAIAASDGTRADISKRLFGLSVPAAESVLGVDYAIDENGDTTIKDMSVFKVAGTDIPYEKGVEVDPALLVQ